MGIKNIILDYFNSRKIIKSEIQKERKMKAQIDNAENDSKIPKERRNSHLFRRNYYHALQDAENMNNEDAINFYKEEKDNNDKEQQIYNKAKEILNKYGLGMPESVEIMDRNLEIAEYILNAKGLDIPDIDFPEREIAIEDVRAKVESAILHIIGFMEYYQQPKEKIQQIEEIFDKICKEEFGEIRQENNKESEDQIR